MAATEADTGGEIVVKGGSCEIHFDDRVIKKDRKDPKKRRHSCATMKIKRIVITGDHNFDSKTMPNGFKGEIRISYTRY
jgi:hypothetical protein